MKLALLPIAVIFVVSYSLSLKIGNHLVSADIEDAQTVVPNSQNDLQLQVKPALKSNPTPLDFNLQGSASKEQQAAGDLQRPQSADELQPNARTDLFSDEL